MRYWTTWVAPVWRGVSRHFANGTIWLAAVLALALAASTPARAEIREFNTNAGGWWVGIDTEMNGCFMDRDFPGGVYLEFGFQPEDSAFFIFISNPDWNSIVPDQRYDILVYFGNETPWEFTGAGAAYGLRDSVNGNGGLDFYLPVDEDVLSLFLTELRETSQVDFHYQGQSIARLSLAGSSVGTSELLRCQDSLATDAPSPDPFSSQKDPFSGVSNKGDPFN